MPDADGLRPSTDRVRETLFNWLMHDLAGAHCLDLFAGSGALGFECLSRGAASVDFVEAAAPVVATLQSSWQQLQDDAAGQARILHRDALLHLRETPARHYDLVFLDPPFQADLLDPVIQLLAAGAVLATGAMVYIEQDARQTPVEVPEHWQLYRQKSAGQSRYSLYQT